MNRFVFTLLLFTVAFIHPASANPNDIEVFDIDQGGVIKHVELTHDIQIEVENLIKQVTDVYQEFEPIPKHGFMVKIPLEPAVKVHNKWLKKRVEEVIIIFPKHEQPHMMLFDIDNDFHFFTFEYDTEPLLKAIDYWPFESLNAKP